MAQIEVMGYSAVRICEHIDATEWRTVIHPLCLDLPISAAQRREIVAANRVPLDALLSLCPEELDILKG